jgi:hypothetical protein
VAGLEPGGTGKARISFAAPLLAAARGDAELLDLLLVERRRAWEVRDALSERLPPGHHWVGLEDVWLGAPPLAGRVTAADWSVRVSAVGSARTVALAAAAARLLAARELIRSREKGGATRSYDLRPLLVGIEVDPAPASGSLDSSAVVRFRTRIHPELGSGRPEEVLGALGEAVGWPLVTEGLTRTRIVLADDPVTDPVP